jgi:hypothetical protein
VDELATEDWGLARRSIFRAAGWLSLAFTLCCWTMRSAVAETAQNLGGTWQGTTQGANGMRIVLMISRDGHGDNEIDWKGVFYSIDQEVQGRLIPSIAIQGTDCRFAIPAIDARYVGKLGADGSSITGTWTQGKASSVLNLVRATGDTEWPIPQPAANMAAECRSCL